ncbi:amp-Dependent synthetase and ligase [Arthrobacter sp. Hiyo8]|nr:amp-Dependent synthetase and ligase [Arthrobacter sp. Hiyo8]
MLDEVRGQKVVAGIVPAYGSVTATQVKTGLDGLLARDKRPLRYFTLSELPVTDRGKVSRQMLLDWIENNDPRAKPLPSRERGTGLDPSRQPVIIAALRTPICRANGQLKPLRAEELLAPVLRSLLKTTGVAGPDVTDVVIGNAVGGAETWPGMPHCSRDCRWVFQD